jgi:hypothetical protein
MLYVGVTYRKLTHIVTLETVMQKVFVYSGVQSYEVQCHEL